MFVFFVLDVQVRSNRELLSESQQQVPQQQQQQQQAHNAQQQQPSRFRGGAKEVQDRKQPRDANGSARFSSTEGRGHPVELTTSVLAQEEHPRGHQSPSKRARSTVFWMYFKLASMMRSRQLRAAFATVLMVVLVLWLLRTPARIGKKEVG